MHLAYTCRYTAILEKLERRLKQAELTVRRRRVRTRQRALLARLLWMSWVRWAQSHVHLWALLCFALAFAGNATLASIRGIQPPMVQDEFGYTLAADTFAHGRFTNPPHELWRSFETFHILQHPTYQTKYPPVQAVFLAIGQVTTGFQLVGAWLGGALMCYATAWMLFQWMRPRWAVLGGTLMVLTFGITTYWTYTYWGGATTALGGAITYGALGALRKRPHWWHSALFVLGLGIMGNSRPFEGAVLGVPAVCCFMALLWKNDAGIARKLGMWIAPAAIVALAIASIMGLYNYRVTGSATKMPYSLYLEQYEVTPVFLFGKFRPEPAYTNPHLREFNAVWIPANYCPNSYGLVDLCIHAWGKITDFAGFYGKRIWGWDPLVLPLIAIPILTWRTRWVRFALASLACLLTAHALSMYYQPHYTAGATAVLIFLGATALRWLAVQGRRRGRWGSKLVVWFLIFTCGAFVYRWVVLILPPEKIASPLAMRPLMEAAILRENPGKHVVLVRPGPFHSMHMEYVYNTANIDQQDVIWARFLDVGTNQKLMAYYPERTIWLLTTQYYSMNKIRDPVR